MDFSGNRVLIYHDLKLGHYPIVSFLDICCWLVILGTKMIEREYNNVYVLVGFSV